MGLKLVLVVAWSRSEEMLQTPNTTSRETSHHHSNYQVQNLPNCPEIERELPPLSPTTGGHTVTRFRTAARLWS